MLHPSSFTGLASSLASVPRRFHAISAHLLVLKYVALIGQFLKNASTHLRVFERVLVIHAMLRNEEFAQPELESE